MRKPYPPNVPPEVHTALDAFTDAELNDLTVFYGDVGEFIGVGIHGPHRNMMKFGDPLKAAALEVLEEQARLEYEELCARATLRVEEITLEYTAGGTLK